MAADDLIGVAGVAELLEVTATTARIYARRSDFPEPEHKRANRRAWSQREVESWAAKTLLLPRGPGRPPRSKS